MPNFQLGEKAQKMQQPLNFQQFNQEVDDIVKFTIVTKSIGRH